MGSRIWTNRASVKWAFEGGTKALSSGDGDRAHPRREFSSFAQELEPLEANGRSRGKIGARSRAVSCKKRPSV